ncbi:unnamed protein product [Haemonchus placei]|uniref:Uncharacterized protein n=1 Tax=Haemonchus placei TaxID=6290 RepID=A0A0N4XBM5_HAEPC|nr:unnamed protein product [Haemonchus placei]
MVIHSKEIATHFGSSDDSRIVEESSHVGPSMTFAIAQLSGCISVSREARLHLLQQCRSFTTHLLHATASNFE